MKKPSKFRLHIKENKDLLEECSRITAYSKTTNNKTNLSMSKISFGNITTRKKSRPELYNKVIKTKQVIVQHTLTSKLKTRQKSNKFEIIVRPKINLIHYQPFTKEPNTTEAEFIKRKQENPYYYLNNPTNLRPLHLDNLFCKESANQAKYAYRTNFTANPGLVRGMVSRSLKNKACDKHQSFSKIFTSSSRTIKGNDIYTDTESSNLVLSEINPLRNSTEKENGDIIFISDEDRLIS